MRLSVIAAQLIERSKQSGKLEEKELSRGLTLSFFGGAINLLGLKRADKPPSEQEIAIVERCFHVPAHRERKEEIYGAFHCVWLAWRESETVAAKSPEHLPPDSTVSEPPPVTVESFTDGQHYEYQGKIYQARLHYGGWLLCDVNMTWPVAGGERSECILFTDHGLSESGGAFINGSLQWEWGPHPEKLCPAHFRPVEVVQRLLKLEY